MPYCSIKYLQQNKFLMSFESKMKVGTKEIKKFERQIEEF